MLDDTQNRKVYNTLGIERMKNFEVAINIRLLFPEAEIEFDNDGQIIIYTGVYEEDPKSFGGALKRI